MRLSTRKFIYKKQTPATMPKMQKHQHKNGGLTMTYDNGIYQTKVTPPSLIILKETHEIRILDKKGKHILTFRNLEHYNTERKQR
jgi:hypothetical protein